MEVEGLVGCDQGIEVIVKMQKKKSGWGAKVDMNEELKLF